MTVAEGAGVRTIGGIGRVFGFGAQDVAAGGLGRVALGLVTMVRIYPPSVTSQAGG